MRESVLIAAAIGFSAAGCGRPETATPEIQTREVEYRQGETTLQGFVAWDQAIAGQRPGVLVVHEWWGHNQHARNQARRLAEAGYVGFALDMYGKGMTTSHPDSARTFVTEATRDPATLIARFNAALEQLKQDPHVDPDRIAAIGYCFGGGVVLSQARAGADLDAVASFHGGLGGMAPVAPGQVKARVLVLTGAADPMIPPDQVDAFHKEMTAAGATIEVISYPIARHSFTNPDANRVGMEALAYDAEADRQSWDELLKMLRDVFP